MAAMHGFLIRTRLGFEYEVLFDYDGVDGTGRMRRRDPVDGGWLDGGWHAFRRVRNLTVGERAMFDWTEDLPVPKLTSTIMSIMPTLSAVPDPPAPDPFVAVLDELLDLHVRKSADYGRDGDPVANLRAVTEFGLKPWVGVAIRMSDKMRRLASAHLNGGVVNDSVEDDFLDLAVYAILGLTLFRESKDG